MDFDLAQYGIPLVVGGLILVLLLFGYTYSQFYIKSPPDVATILTGRRGTRIIRGGATLRIPVVERIDKMSLAPFELNVVLKGVISGQGVAVGLEATALVRFASDDESIKTAAERFLNADRRTLQNTVQEVLTGHMRSIIAKMSVEELNSNREQLVAKVAGEAGTDFSKLGMQLDVLTIKHITDDVGYLNAMGRTRTAEVLRDATIGEANAIRDSDIESAKARQAGRTAQATADAAIAEAERDRDIKIAMAQADVQAEQARAEQAGPLATAERKRAVVEAEVAVDRQRVESEIAVEQQRVEKAKQATEADIVVPAEAERRAAIVRAEGERDAAIATAEGEQQRRAKEGQGEAEARISLADATRKELEAQAAGEQAQLQAEATGRRELAEALNSYDAVALQLTLGPDLIRQLAPIVEAGASSFKNVERIVMIDGGSQSGDGPIDKFVGKVPVVIASGLEVLKAVGLDLSAFTTPTGENGNGRGRVRVNGDQEDKPGATAEDATSDGTPEA